MIARKTVKASHQHEDLAAAGTKQRVAHDDHHVTNRRRGARRTLHGITAIEEVVGREIFDEIAE